MEVILVIGIDFHTLCHHQVFRHFHTDFGICTFKEHSKQIVPIHNVCVIKVHHHYRQNYRKLFFLSIHTSYRVKALNS